MTVQPINQRYVQSVVLDGAGAGTVQIVPRADFAAQQTTWRVQGGTGTNQSTAQIELNGDFWQGTYSGNNDSSPASRLITNTDIVECAWTGGPPGGTATLTMFGVEYPAGQGIPPPASSGGPTNPILGGETLIRNSIRSEDYSVGVSGWSIFRDGSAEFNNVVARGTVIVNGNDMSSITILTELVSPGRVAAEMKLAPGTYSDGFTPLPVPALIQATSDRSGTTQHWGTLIIQSPEYSGLSSSIRMSGAVQEIGSGTTVTEINTDFFVVANPFGGTMQAVIDGSLTLDNGGSLVLGKIDMPYAIVDFTLINVPNNVANPSLSPLTVASAPINNKGMWVSGSSVTINKTGVYEVGMCLNYATNGTGFRQARFNVNGVSAKAWNMNANNSSSNTDVGGTYKIALNSGDVVTFSPYQNSGGALSLTGINRGWVKYDCMT